MENCNIYSHNLEFEKVVKIVKSNLPNAKIEFKDEKIHKSLVAVIKKGLFGKKQTLTINYRQRENPSNKLEEIECGLTQNLVGMVNFIQSFPASNEEVRNKFLLKVMSVNCEMAFIAEPEITSQNAIILKEIVQELDGFIFTPSNRIFKKSNTQHFLDKNFNLIIDTNGNCEIQDIEVTVDSKYNDEQFKNKSDKQKERKSKSELFLKEKGIKVNTNLPCIEDELNIKLRDIEEVVDRAYALLVIGLKGEGIEQNHLDRLVKEKNITSFSAKEEIIFQSTELTEQERAYATWRYESLYVMLWALGKFDRLKYPDEICNVEQIVELIYKPTREEFRKSVVLKSVAKVVDELDLTYRMNWACVDARINEEKVSGNIDPSIVYERHFSLNWLINYQNQDWDDIQTDT